MRAGGYAGKILFADLTAGKLYEKDLFDYMGEDLRKWIGGRGLGVYIMLREANPKADPLSPDNIAIAATGPLTGIPGLVSPGRWVSITKSPLTNTIHDAHSGGKFGPELKFAGYDAVVVKGKSEKPVYIWIHNGRAELRDASHLWGMDTHSTTDAIIEELSASIGKDEAQKIKVATIGPAGERLSRIANIINDKSRAAGRGGHGAVWGSKRLKAIAVRGTMRLPIAREEEYRKVSAHSIKLARESPVTSEGLPKYGTAILVNIINAHGMLPTRNFRTGVFPEADKISGERIAETILDPELQKQEICWGCIIGCSRGTRIKGKWSGEGGGPEYETVWALGAATGVSNLEAVTKANYLCNELGLDTISMGATIATLFELVEKGKVPAEKLRGLNAKWGSDEALVELVWRTAYRSGIGDDLAEGGARLAQKYGAPEVAMAVRGQELPAYDPRGAKGQGLAYATSNRGGDHLRAYMISPEILGLPYQMDRHSIEGKAKMTIHFQDVFAALDSLVVCKFVTFSYWNDVLAAQLSAVTGWDISVSEFDTIGERIYNAERAFNVLAFGDGEEYDTLPARLLKEPMPEGPSKGQVVELEPMLREFYQLRGWVKGRPTRQTLERLGLHDLAKRLEAEGLLPA